MSGINSLLRYRFTKEKTKIQHNGEGKSDNSQDNSSSQSDGRETPDVNSDPSVINETPTSHLSSPRENGVSKSSSAASSGPASETEEEKESSGPWLSKKQGSLLTGFNDALLKKKQVTLLSFGRRRLKSDSESSSDDEEGDEDNESADSDSQCEGEPGKRKYKDLSLCDSESPGLQPKRRRVKMLSESSTEEQSAPSQESNLGSQSQGISSQETIPSSQVLEDHVRNFREAFPAATVERIKAVLKEQNYDLGKTSEVLVRDIEPQADETKPEPESVPNGVSNGHGTKDVKDDDDDEADIDMEDSDDEEDSSEREPVLSFFNNATMDELTAMPKCSKAKSEVIIQMRPFETWENLVEQFQVKPLSYSLITGCVGIIQIREVVTRLMQRCEKISERLGSLVSGLAGDVTVEEFEDQITTQPKNLNPSMEMKPYQLVGLNWLRLMHTQELNGILADEMGLGKTVQAISFLAHLLEEGDEGPHIIVVPSSTIENWLRELTTWCPDLQVVLYYGSQDDRRRLRKEILYEDTSEYNIVLTTYNMASGSPEDRSLFKSIEFHYAVFDEGHMLKNMTSQRYQHLQKIWARRRLLLTGTPLQNNLLELMSLLCFVMPEMFVGKTESVKRMFTTITAKVDEGRGNYEKETIVHAKNIMKPFVLRRLKTEVLHQLPKKEESVEFCPMVPSQQVRYDNLAEAFSKKYMELESTPGEDKGKGTAMLMQLRKLANHPLLIRHIFTDEKLKEMSIQIAKEPSHRDRGALPHIIEEDMAVMSDYELHTLCLAYKKYLGEYQLETDDIERSGKFFFLDKFLEKKKEQGDRVLLFSQFTMMLDIVEAFIKLKGYKYLRLDGQTAVVDRQQMIDEYNQNKDIFIFLLSTKAGGMGINLTAANVVVIHDIDFNPYNDKQAEDRCHRVGQTRSVEVVKLISQGTVEEGMLSCAKYKLNLEKHVTSTEADEEENSRDILSLLKNALGQHLKKEETNTCEAKETTKTV